MLSMNPSDAHNPTTQPIAQNSFEQTYAERSVSRTLSFVTHDIRNLLTVISLNAEKLLNVEHLQQNKIGDRILNQVDQITAICTAAGGPNNSHRAKPHYAPATPMVMIADTISDVIKSIQEPNSNVKFEVDCDVDLGLDMCRATLFRILYNIVSNAFKAISDTENPQITIRAAKISDRLQIDIIDNGPGLPKDIQKVLTSKRPDNSWKGGLGILIANMLIQEQSGTLDLLESTSQGTHFRLAIEIKPC